MGVYHFIIFDEMVIGSKVAAASGMEEQVDSDEDLKDVLKTSGIHKLYRKINYCTKSSPGSSKRG